MFTLSWKYEGSDIDNCQVFNSEEEMNEKLFRVMCEGILEYYRIEWKYKG